RCPLPASKEGTDAPGANQETRGLENHISDEPGLLFLQRRPFMGSSTNMAQIRVNHPSPAQWRITFDNPPLNLMGPELVLGFRDIMAALEADEEVKVVVF